MRESLLVVSLLLIFGTTACRKAADHTPAIGEAFAGPATLDIRKDIPTQSPRVATVKHGERLEITQHRRRFMRVRTPRGVEGWVDDHQLLSSGEIAALQEVERRALTLPSQGLASTNELLNVHTEPNRMSPSFLQVKEGEKVDVVGHAITPRTPPVRPPLLQPKPKTLPHKHADAKYPLPPNPLPPPPPVNWRELSKTPPEVQQQIAEEKAQNAAPTDDWSLVRNSKGQSGWVLTHRIFMAIPDDVAQYAEGHRITSYFPLTDVQDEGQVKHNWFWTTIAGSHSYDFDSFRVFIWSTHRHRYETAFIQRNVEGYFPVLRRNVDVSSNTKARVDPAATLYPGFSVCLATESGGRVRRNYAFIVNVVRFAGEQPCEAPGQPPADQTVANNAGQPSPATLPANASLYARFKARMSAFTKRLFNR